MELTQLRYFLEVAKSQHMTKSAEKLHIAQPALSQVIRRLEGELGAPLFVRKGRNIVLTEYGEYLQKQLTPLMDRLDRLPEEIQEMAHVNHNTIRLNVLAASTLVTEAIIRYKEQHPEINFRLLQNMQSDVHDIEITTRMFYQSDPAKAKVQYVCAERIFLAVPNSEKYAGVNAVSLKDVEQEGFISLMGSRQFRHICDKFCRHAGVTPQIIFESDNPATVRNMIAANMGVGFWPEFSWGKLDTQQVRLLEIQDPVCSRDILIDYHPRNGERECARLFFEFLCDYCQHLIL